MVAGNSKYSLGVAGLRLAGLSRVALLLLAAGRVIHMAAFSWELGSQAGTGSSHCPLLSPSRPSPSTRPLQLESRGYFTTGCLLREPRDGKATEGLVTEVTQLHSHCLPALSG